MSDEFTPTTEQVRDGYRYDPEAEWRDPITPHHIINGRAFDRWLAAHDRVVAANAWDECKKELWSEIRQIPSWTDPANGHTEFDLQPLGPDATSEYGARELIVDIFEEIPNPYRITEENN